MCNAAPPAPSRSNINYALLADLVIDKVLEPRVLARCDAARVTIRRLRHRSVTSTTTNLADISDCRRLLLRAGSDHHHRRPTSGIPAKAEVLRDIGLRVRPNVTSGGRCLRRVGIGVGRRRRGSVVTANGDTRRRRSAIACRRQATGGGQGEKEQVF